MKIVLNTDSALSAIFFRNTIIKAIKGNIDDIFIRAWSYTRSGDNYDIIYYNLEQYTRHPEKNVLFRLTTDGANIVFSTAWWRKNPEPEKELLCLHVGRLTEMLLRYYSDYFIKFTIIS